jgi:hypothetical protein
VFTYFNTGNKILETRGPNMEGSRRRERDVTAVDIYFMACKYFEVSPKRK